MLVHRVTEVELAGVEQAEHLVASVHGWPSQAYAWHILALRCSITGCTEAAVASVVISAVTPTSTHSVPMAITTALPNAAM